jgi:hypothetical protein
MLLHDYIVIQTNYFCLQSDLEIKNSSRNNQLLNLQFTFKIVIESGSTF